MAFWDGKERRVHARIRRKVACKASVGSLVMVGSTQDISTGGLRFEADLDAESLKAADKAHGNVTLLLGSQELVLRARVIWIEGNVVALAFKDDSRSEEGKALKEFLDNEVAPDI
tara:strand:+ start:525 stop:869 length:345 start_codon:yes stop_codon:yes gene_type:complete